MLLDKNDWVVELLKNPTPDVIARCEEDGGFERMKGSDWVLLLLENVSLGVLCAQHDGFLKMTTRDKKNLIAEWPSYSTLCDQAIKDKNHDKTIGKTCKRNDL